jgi:hypothetical protein
MVTSTDRRRVRDNLPSDTAPLPAEYVAEQSTMNSVQHVEKATSCSQSITRRSKHSGHGHSGVEHQSAL